MTWKKLLIGFSNSDPTKQSQEAVFSRRSKRSIHPPLVFYNNNVSQTYSQKTPGRHIRYQINTRRRPQ